MYNDKYKLTKVSNKGVIIMMYPNIRAEMGRNNMTIKELANNIGLSTNSVSFKLNGKRQFTLLEIEKIALLFNCSLDYLVGHECKKEENYAGSNVI